MAYLEFMNPDITLDLNDRIGKHNNNGWGKSAPQKLYPLDDSDYTRSAMVRARIRILIKKGQEQIKGQLQRKNGSTCAESAAKPVNERISLRRRMQQAI